MSNALRRHRLLVGLVLGALLGFLFATYLSRVSGLFVDVVLVEDFKEQGTVSRLPHSNPTSATATILTKAPEPLEPLIEELSTAAASPATNNAVVPNEETSLDSLQRRTPTVEEFWNPERARAILPALQERTENAAELAPLGTCVSGIGPTVVHLQQGPAVLVLPPQGDLSVEHQRRKGRYDNAPSSTSAQYCLTVRPRRSHLRIPVRKIREGSSTMRSNSGLVSASMGEMCGEEDSSSSSRQRVTCRGSVVISMIERPQHAFQFLFSLVGIVAMQERYGLYPENSTTAVTLMSYGPFQEWRQSTSYPHLELLNVLGSAAHPVMFFTWPKEKSSFGTIAIPPQTNNGGDVSGSPCRCFESAVFGSLPTRILHYRKQRAGIHVHPSRPEDWTELKRRVYRHYHLNEEPDPLKRVVLLIVRKKQQRRLILNLADVEAVVKQVGFSVVQIDWEGMPVAKQLEWIAKATAVIGMHGNGHVWNCFLPRASLMIEYSSDVASHNEVAEGKNVRNVGNLAQLCNDLESHSFRATAVPNKFSLASPSREWKEVDVIVSPMLLGRLHDILVEHRGKLQR